MGNTPSGSGVKSPGSSSAKPPTTIDSNGSGASSASRAHNAFASPLPLNVSAKHKSSPLVSSRSVSSPLNGSMTHSDRVPQLNTFSPGSMFSPSLRSSDSSAEAGSGSNRHKSIHLAPRSRLGLIPTGRYRPSKGSTNMPTRGSVRIPPPDRTTPASPLSVFSTSVKSEPAPSTAEVLRDLHHKTEKRKRDPDPERSANDIDNTDQAIFISPDQTNCTESKRRKHNSGTSSTVIDTVERGRVPLPSTLSGGVDSQASVVTPGSSQRVQQTSVEVSPKKDGHLRTAIASSYSSSRRSLSSRKRFYNDSTDEPLYKRSINMSYVSWSREGSRRGSPVPLDNDSDSDTRSRVSVTPLPSLKNSPRASPMLRRDRSESPASSFHHHMGRKLLTPKLEARVIFPQIAEPVSGFVATLEDRAHDDELNDRRARRLLGLDDEAASSNSAASDSKSTIAPQVVMPIVRPEITIPDEKALSQQLKAKANSVKATTSEKSSALVGDVTSAVTALTSLADSSTHVQFAGKSLDDAVAASTNIILTSTVLSESVEAAPPSYSLAAAAQNSTGAASHISQPAKSAAVTSLLQEVTSSQSQVAQQQTAGFSFGSQSTSATSVGPSHTAPLAPAAAVSAASTLSAASTFKFGSEPAPKTSTVPVTTASQGPGFNFGFGAPASTPSTSVFGAQTIPAAATTVHGSNAAPATTTALFGFGTTKTADTSLSNVVEKKSQNTSELPSAGFTFGASIGASVVTETPKTSASIFGGMQASSGSAPGFTFGGPAPSSSSMPTTFKFGAPSSSASSVSSSGVVAPAPSKPIFAFGQSQSTSVNGTNISAAQALVFPFGATTSTASTTASTFGTTQASADPAASFSFGATSAAPALGPATVTNSTIGQALSTTIFGALGKQPAAGGFTFGASNPTTTPFGAAAATVSSVPQTNATPFSTTSKAAGLAFGKGPPPFGTANTTSSTSIFGTGSTTTTAATQPSTGVFGATTTSAPSIFGTSGAGSTSGFNFGATNTVFGQPAAPAAVVSVPAKSAFNFGAVANPPAFSAATTAPSHGVFGATGAAAGSTSIFGTGSTQAAAASPFVTSGSGSSTPAFGASKSNTPVFGACTNSAPAFGASTNSAPAFGASTNSAPAFGASINSAPAFGASTNSAPAFGASTNSAPAFGAIGSNTPVFGASTSNTPVFGASSNQPTQFGATTAAAPFGVQPSTATDQTKPTFNFGGTTAPPAFGSQTAAAAPQFQFGAAQPAAAAGTSAGMFSMGTSKVAPRRRTRK